jgi:hypothetical protein
MHLNTILKIVTELCIVEEAASAEFSANRSRAKQESAESAATRARALRAVSFTRVLRHAMRNPMCPAAVLAILLGREGAVGALPVMDKKGIYPLDHFLDRLRAEGSPRAEVTALIDTLCTSVPFQEPHRVLTRYSPLIRFYTKDLSQFTVTCRPLVAPTSSSAEAANNAYASTVMITKRLLHHAPWLATVSSRSSGCLPLHTAVRFYGDRLPLIELLCEAKPETLFHRNSYGYLPLHTACDLGVPPSVLKLLIQATVAATGCPHGHTFGLAPRAILASASNSSDTPTDLVWRRYVLGREHGAESFRPGWDTPRVMRRVDATNSRVDNMLLYTVVARATDTAPWRHGGPRSHLWPLRVVWPSLRILWGATCPNHLAGDTCPGHPDGSSGYPLHQVAVLCQPGPRSLTTAWLDWALWQCSEDVSRLDTCKRTVLHYAVHVAVNEIEEPQVSAWKVWIDKLLEEFPAAVCLLDKNGRLPLHTALDGSNCPGVQGSPANSRVLTEVIAELVELSPPWTIDRPDPLTGLVPALQAATHPLLQLDTIYELLKKKPSVLQRKASGP